LQVPAKYISLAYFHINSFLQENDPKNEFCGLEVIQTVCFIRLSTNLASVKLIQSNGTVGKPTRHSATVCRHGHACCHLVTHTTTTFDDNIHLPTVFTLIYSHHHYHFLNQMLSLSYSVHAAFQSNNDK